MTDFELFLDSSIWLGYFIGDVSEAKKLIGEERKILFTSIISIHEIFKKLVSVKTENQAMSAVKFIESNSIIVGVDKEIALNAAINCKKYKLHSIDSLIYSSAVKTKAVFVTADKDFQKTPNTKLIEIK